MRHYSRSLAAPVDDVVTLVASATTTVALFTIGALLTPRSTDAEVAVTARAPRTFDIGWLAALKLFIHPGLAWSLGTLGIAGGLPLSQENLHVLVLVAALPFAANAAMLAERLGANGARIAAVILVSTVIGFGTFTATALLL